ncbi:MAG: nucleotide exchange factor GrpE, partial [Treponema sp.]|nr:nucleotide exchange factor GrpE [Treponema sp.]
MSEEVNEKETESESQADIPVEKETEADETEVQASEETVTEEESQESELYKAKKRIEELEAEAADYKDKYLRAVADFQNLRKRSIQEKQEAFDYANTNLLKDLLDSPDNFDRTVEAASSASDP